MRIVESSMRGRMDVLRLNPHLFGERMRVEVGVSVGRYERRSSEGKLNAFNAVPVPLITGKERKEGRMKPRML